MERNTPIFPYEDTVEKFEQFGLNIRPACDEDLEQIKELKMQIYGEECLSPTLAGWYKDHPEAFEEEFYGPEGQEPEKRAFYIVEDPEEEIFRQPLVGCGGLIQKDPEEEPDTGELIDIYLHKDIRGVGLGESLVRDLINSAEDMGFNELFLTTRREFPAANSLYEKLGFERAPNPKYDSDNSFAYEKEL